MMKNFILLASFFACLFISCGEEDPDITGMYTLKSLNKSCSDSSQDLSVVEGDNVVLGTDVNFSGSMLFTAGGAFEAEYLLEAAFSQEEVFIEGTYIISTENFNVCGTNGCLDNPVPTGSQVTVMVQEGDCLLTLVGEPN